MALKIDHSKAEGGFTLLPKGEYEVFAKVFDTSVSQSGNDMVSFNYVVREDVPGQEDFKGQEIRFDRFVDTEAAHWRVHAASKASGMEHGVEYDTLEEWARAFKGRSLRVIVDHREYNGKTYPEVKGFKESQVGGSLPNESPFEGNDGKIVVDDDSLPF
jgi:hypothetical protein